MSEVKVNKLSPRSGTTVTIGDSGDTINIVGTLQNNGSAIPGDISSVVAGTGLSGGGTSGDVTLNVEAAQSGVTSLGTLTALTVNGNVSVDGGTIKLDGNYPTGTGNVALGDTALDSVEAGGNYNVAIGSAALTTNTTGDTNTAVGHHALKLNTTASDNTGIGRNALCTTTTGCVNTAMGSSAMQSNTTGDKNVAIGGSALFANTTADFNTAVGKDALSANTTGASNVAMGQLALANNTTASDNTAVGRCALFANTTGISNVAVGYNSLGANTSGCYNTALGQNALDANTTALSNTAIGRVSLSSNTTGENNTGLGMAAGYEVTTGANNLLLGKDAGRATSPSGTITTGSNQVVLGNDSITNLWCADTSISSSDLRDKTDIEDFTYGLDFVTKLKPKTYRWDKRSWYVTGDESVLDVTPDGSKKRNKKHIGFMAQDVLALEKEIGFSNNSDDMLVVNQTEDKTRYGLKYERLVPVLVNAIKELKAEIELLKNK